MKLKVIVHEAEEGGYWAKVPAIPGCATQGETFEELLTNFSKSRNARDGLTNPPHFAGFVNPARANRDLLNLYEAVEACLSVDVEEMD